MCGGADGDGVAVGDVVVEFNFGEFDSEYGGVPGRVAAGGAVADFLSGDDGDDRIGAGRIWGRRGWWRRDWISFGDDDAGGIWIYVPAGAA